MLNISVLLRIHLKTYIAPALCIILPILYLNKELPRNGFLILASITIPTFYGLAITGLRVSTSAIFFSLMFVFVEAGKLALAKKWFLRKGGSPLDAIFQYLPVSSLALPLLPKARKVHDIDKSDDNPCCPPDKPYHSLLLY